MTEVFDVYAAYYDRFYADKDYAGEARYVADLIASWRPGPCKILELGCGTGAHAAELARMGHTVLGIDRSDRMLQYAGRRRDTLPRQVADRIRFESGDVRTFRADASFDCVLSLFHVFSYQTRSEDLRAAFETAGAHLSPGGIAVFDYWYGPAVLTTRPETRTRTVEDELVKITRRAEPTLHHADNVVRVHFTVEVQEKAHGQTHAFSEDHDMRYLFLPEIDVLCSPPFTVQRHLGWQKHTAPELDDWSAVTVLEKRP